MFSLRHKLLGSLILLLIFDCQADDITKLAVNAGKSVVLPCGSGSLDSVVNWWYQSRPSEQAKEVCVNGLIINGFRRRFTLQSPSTGDYSLVIKDTLANDTGLYICGENQGFGTRHSVQLNVTEVKSDDLLVTAPVGGKAILPCGSARLDSVVNWWYQNRTSGEQAKEVCVNGNLMNGYSARFQLQSPSNGNYSLVINDVTVQDSGLYVCGENQGFGQRHSVILKVSETPPAPSAVNPSAGAPDNSNECPTASDESVSVDGIIVAFVIAFLVDIILVVIIAGHFLRNSQWIQKTIRAAKRMHPSSNRISQNLLTTPDDSFWPTCLASATADRSTEFDRVPSAQRSWTLLMRYPQLFDKCVTLLGDHVRKVHPGVEVIVGIDCHGVAFGLSLAQKLQLPFVVVRRPGALIGETFGLRDNLQHQFEVHRNACKRGQKVILVDDELVTGGTQSAVTRLLVEQLEVNVVECLVVIEKLGHNARQRLSVPVFALISMH